jgi:protein-disulfide isomerase
LTRRFVLARIPLACLWAGSAPAQRTGGGEKAFGNPGAPIRLEVFSDYQCRACKRLYQDVLLPLMKDYVLTSKVYLIHRDLPLRSHAHSREAALYANAAFRVNRFEQVATELFRQQSVWEANGRIDEVVSRVVPPADMEAIRTLVRAPNLGAELQQAADQARNAGIRQTPTLILTHDLDVHPMAGYIDYVILRSFLDHWLAPGARTRRGSR